MLGGSIFVQGKTVRRGRTTPIRRPHHPPQTRQEEPILWTGHVISSAGMIKYRGKEDVRIALWLPGWSMRLGQCSLSFTLSSPVNVSPRIPRRPLRPNICFEDYDPRHSDTLRGFGASNLGGTHIREDQALCETLLSMWISCFHAEFDLIMCQNISMNTMALQHVQW